LESQVGVGSTFTITLPLPGIPEEVARDELAASDESREHAQALNGEKMVQTWLQGMQGNPALEGILLEGLKYLPEKIRILEDAICRNIPADIKFISHSLKGVSGNLGLTEIYAHVLEIDQEIRNEAYNLERVKVVFAQLQKIVASIPPSYFGSGGREIKGIADMTSQFTILVAEDNEVNQMLIQELLEGMSLRCELAENGEIAVSKLKKQKYDLVLLDMQMPVLDGVETIKRIRSDEILKDLYVIALTAYATKGDAEKYLDLGCNDYLPKPIRIEQFRERIHQVLLKNVIRQDQETLMERTETADFEPSNVLLNPEQCKTLQEIMHGLQENCEIFNPSQIAALAEKLTEFSSIKDVQTVKEKLAAVADTFDDQALKPIVKKLEKILNAHRKYHLNR